MSTARGVRPVVRARWEGTRGIEERAGYSGSGRTSGWTVFCCTINKGVNACPPGSFAAGWWKARFLRETRWPN